MTENDVESEFRRNLRSLKACAIKLVIISIKNFSREYILQNIVSSEFVYSRFGLKTHLFTNEPRKHRLNSRVKTFRFSSEHKNFYDFDRRKVKWTWIFLKRRIICYITLICQVQFSSGERVSLHRSKRNHANALLQYSPCAC